MAKRANERDSARVIVDNLLNHFVSGVQGHQLMIKYAKRRQRNDESIEKFLDDLEIPRTRGNREEKVIRKKPDYSLQVHGWVEKRRPEDYAGHSIPIIS